MSSNHLQQDIASSNEQGKYLTPFQRKLLQKSLQENLPQQYRLRIEIMLLADRGKTQTQICQALGCSVGTARHWICMAQSGQAHKWNNNPIGKPKIVNDQYLERLKEVVSHNPREFGYPFQRWTSQWLSKHLTKELGIEVGDRHIRRLLKDMGLSTRLKPSSPKEAINQTDTYSIVIADLSSAKVPSFFTLDPFK
ncbi:transposase [Scytonema sp. NUACC26]|uniref:helix-turn-helix domain-containing protein n=1 Tax=Scytonema sp. NUACC26 TaxID=3140176 RepID=UPI0034DBE458